MHPPAHKPEHDTRSELRAIIRLATPVALAQLGIMAMGVVDVIMVGHLSPLALAAVSLGHSYTFSMMVLGMGILFVLDPFISQAYGARDTPGLSRAMHRGGVLALFLSAVLAILFIAGRPVLELLAGQPEVVPIAHGYARVIALGLPAFFLFLVVKQTLQAMSIVRPVMIAVGLANIANIFLNLGFVFGEFGFPALGAVGSAWATTCSRTFMVLILMLVSTGALKRVWHPPDRSILRLGAYLPMLGKGIQIGIQMALELWVFSTVSLLMMRMGVVEMGGHTVALNLASLSFMVPLGIGAAAATRVGNAIGAGDQFGARLSARVALFLGGGVMLVSATLFILFPGPLARLYTGDAQVLDMAMLLLPIAGIFQVCDGIQAVACGVLRGAGVTRVPMMLNLIGYWVLGLPCGLLLTHVFDLGPGGLWWGLTIGLSFCAVTLVWYVTVRCRDKL